MAEKLPESFLELLTRQYADIIAPDNCGFGCGDGWYSIVAQCCEVLVEANKLLPPDQPKMLIAQVKEKFGTLRFYVDNATPEVRDKISELTNQTETMCEVCGKAGKPNQGLSKYSWTKTLCKSCAKKRYEREKADQVEYDQRKKKQNDID